MLKEILLQYGLIEDKCEVTKLGTGLINYTWKVKNQDDVFVLQKINHQVFKNPEIIDQNTTALKQFLAKFYPNYLFVAPAIALNGRSLIKTEEGYYRLFQYVIDSKTLNFVENTEEAYEAAKQFGKFTNILAKFEIEKLQIPLNDFHNLKLRYHQFLEAIATGNIDRISECEFLIKEIKSYHDLVNTYNEIVDKKLLPLRVIHHDTKISNVLFNEFNKGICVIDLDTVMPGYFISDVGDMMRTYLSPANEEVTDFEKVIVRTEIFEAIYKGYISELGDELSEVEKSYFIYSGKFLIYMQAMRFLTDYLNNDSYYGAAYPKHNYNRAINQLKLLKEYFNKENDFKKIMSK